jgi:sugar lactone lactonase YvrE
MIKEAHRISLALAAAFNLTVQRGVPRDRYTVPGAEQVTSCAFGGPNLDQLYITTAACGIDEARLKTDQVNAGHLFKLDLSAEGIKGVKAFSYKL